MDFSFSDLNLQLDGLLPINFNSVVTDNVAMLPSIENLPGFEARAAFLCYGKALEMSFRAAMRCQDRGIDGIPVCGALWSRGISQ